MELSRLKSEQKQTHLVVLVKLFYLFECDSFPANAFGLYDARRDKNLCMDPPHLLPGVLVVELTLEHGVEGGGREILLYLDDRHLAVHAHLLHVNVHGDKLQKEQLIVGFTPHFSGVLPICPLETRRCTVRT